MRLFIDDGLEEIKVLLVHQIGGEQGFKVIMHETNHIFLLDQIQQIG